MGQNKMRKKNTHIPVGRVVFVIMIKSKVMSLNNDTLINLQESLNC